MCLRSSLCLAPFFAVGVLSCSSETSSDGHGGSIIPGMADAYYSVDVDLGATEADVQAMYFQEGSLAESIEFSQGESVHVNGTALPENDIVGVSYFATMPLISPGDSYTFLLNVPGKGSYSTAVVMPQTAKLTAPANNRIVPVAGSVAIAWTNSDPRAGDEVDVDFMPNGDGTEATLTLNADAGATTVGLSATELASLYQKASGSVGGMVLGTLTLKRGHTATLSSPFAGGKAEISWQLDQVTIALMK